MDMAVFFSAHTWPGTDRRARAVLQTMAKCSQLQWRLRKGYGHTAMRKIALCC
jgi:hypothetical protein